MQSTVNDMFLMHLKKYILRFIFYLIYSWFSYESVSAYTPVKEMMNTQNYLL